jgi:hypothetical protein
VKEGRTIMGRAIIAAIVIASLTAPALAKNCVYEGKEYSDGAKNDKGQVCDGQTGSWK